MEEKTERPRLLARVGQELGRELATQTLFLHTLIADSAGLNATDARCLEILARPRSDPRSELMTAGDLKKATGLTTGAITGILDRLEQAGFVKRMRDAEDRRKILVKLVPGAGLKLGAHYKRIGAEMEKLAASYTTRELQLIEGFLDANLTILNQQISLLASQKRGRAAAR